MSAASATDLRLSAPLQPRFAAVYAEHVDYVWTNLRRLGVPAAELDDAVQETFLVAFRRWDDFREGSAWRSWLFGIARRVASHHRRGSGRRLRLVDAVAREPRRELELDDDVALRDAARLVHRFLKALPTAQREVFILAELEGHTGAHIAQLLQIKPNTVWSRLRASRQGFERYLQTLRARERSEAKRWDRSRLIDEASRNEAAPEGPRRSIMAALGVQLALPQSAAPVAVGATWLAMLKPAAIAIALSVTTLTSIGVVSRALGPAADSESGTVASSQQRTAESHSSDAKVGGASSVRGSANEPVTRVGDVSPASSGVTARDATPHDPNALPPNAPSKVGDAPATNVKRTGRSATDSPTADPRASETTGSVATTSATTSGEALRLEMNLLQQMRAEAKADRHDRVLVLAQQHAEQFPEGTLAAEREIQRIGALCGRGEVQQASTHMAAFSRRFPSVALPPAVVVRCRVAAEEK